MLGGLWQAQTCSPGSDTAAGPWRVVEWVQWPLWVAALVSGEDRPRRCHVMVWGIILIIAAELLPVFLSL